MTPAPVDLRIERQEPVFIEVARHGGGIELPPGMRIDERSGQMEEAKAGRERQDEKEREVVAVDRRPPGDKRTDCLIKCGGLDVFGPCDD